MGFRGITKNTPAAQPAHIIASDDGAIYESIMGGDRVMNIGNKLKATVITNNKVRISDGVLVVGGRAGRVPANDPEDVTIENGVSGQKRNDLIVARFLQGATDDYVLTVVKGASGSIATDPAVTKGNLYAGDPKREFPIWRVCIDGLSIVRVEQMFKIGKTLSELETENEELNSKLISGIAILDNSSNEIKTKVVSIPAQIDTNYTVIATLYVETPLTSYNKNYDVEVVVGNKTLNTFTIQIHRGFAGVFDAGAVFKVNYLVIRN